MIFKPYHLYEIHPDSGLGYNYILLINSEEALKRPDNEAFSYLPVVKNSRRNFDDPFRVAVEHTTKGGFSKLPGRHFVVIDAPFTFDKRFVITRDYGRVNAREESAIRAALRRWLAI